MDIWTIIGIGLSLCLAGLGAGLGLRLLQFRRWVARSASEGETDKAAHAVSSQIKAEDCLRHRLNRPRGSRRTTTIHGINRLGYLRHTDGSYTKAYAVEMPTTLYADDAEVDRLHNDWARMLQSARQANCLIQTRHDVWADSGRAIHQHLKAQTHAADTYMPARMLHTVGLTGTESLARKHWDARPRRADEVCRSRRRDRSGALRRTPSRRVSPDGADHRSGHARHDAPHRGDGSIPLLTGKRRKAFTFASLSPKKPSGRQVVQQRAGQMLPCDILAA